MRATPKTRQLPVISKVCDMFGDVQMHLRPVGDRAHRRQFVTIPSALCAMTSSSAEEARSDAGDGFVREAPHRVEARAELLRLREHPRRAEQTGHAEVFETLAQIRVDVR